jgi:hypothetical protein
MHTINVLPNPTHSAPCSLVREATKKKLGLAVLNEKDPFTWSDIRTLVASRSLPHTSFCSWIVAVMTPIFIACFCRYNDVAILTCKDVQFFLSYVELRFAKRKNNKHRLCS